MKNNISLSMICLLAILSLASCKKTTEKTTLEKIKGKWSLGTREEITVINGVTTRDTEAGKAGEYIDFRENGKVYLKEGTSPEEEANYVVDNDSQLTFIYDGTDRSVFKINELTANKFVLSAKETINATKSLKNSTPSTSDTAPRNTIETIITLTR